MNAVRLQPIWLSCALAAALCCIGGSSAGETHAPADAAMLTRVHAACVAAMVKSTCSVMNDRSRRSVAVPGEVVFVAGVGAIDAAGYRQIQSYGEQMCSHVRQACLTTPRGAQCRTAMNLWGS